MALTRKQVYTDMEKVLLKVFDEVYVEEKPKIVLQQAGSWSDPEDKYLIMQGMRIAAQDLTRAEAEAFVKLMD